MKAKPIFIAVAAIFSASAIAGGGQHSSSQGASQEIQAQAQGQNQELVKQAQEKLSAAGHDAGAPDGKAGPKTQAALKEFQQSRGLQASGQLDSQTLAALDIGTPEATASSSSAGASSEPASGTQEPSKKQ